MKPTYAELLIHLERTSVELEDAKAVLCEVQNELEDGLARRDVIRTLDNYFKRVWPNG